MLTDSRIVYLILYVNDLDISRRFYEDILGFRAIEEDRDSVKYDGGHVILLLNRAADYGIQLTPNRDHSTDIVFLVDDLETARATLESRGVSFTPTVSYEIGSIADFYDPDQHWFTLYQPGEEALDWPSGAKIKAVLNARSMRNGYDSVLSPSPANDGFELHGKELIYLFFFVRDADEALEFYNHKLGLRDIEGGPCSSGTTGDEDGVIKYDGGGLLFTTHYTDLSLGPQPEFIDEHVCPPRIFDPKYARGVAPVFYVPDIVHAVEELTSRGIHFSGEISRSQIGGIIRFEDPSGHLFFLYEPSSEALSWPSGTKLRQILAAPLDRADTPSTAIHA